MYDIILLLKNTNVNYVNRNRTKTIFFNCHTSDEWVHPRSCKVISFTQPLCTNVKFEAVKFGGVKTGCKASVYWGQLPYQGHNYNPPFYPPTSSVYWWHLCGGWPVCILHMLHISQQSKLAFQFNLSSLQSQFYCVVLCFTFFVSFIIDLSCETFLRIIKSDLSLP